MKLLAFPYKKSPKVIYQSESAECGLACIAMIMDRHGNESGLLNLRKKYKLSSSGASIRDLISIASSEGFTCRALKLSLAKVRDLKLPCIIHWNFNHFVVLESVNKNTVQITDPSEGKREVSLHELSDSFTGVALELVPSDDFTTSESVNEQLKIKDLFSNASGLYSNIARIATLSLIVQIFLLASPLYLRYVVDDALAANDENLLLILTLSFSVIALAEVLARFVRSITIIDFSAQSSYYIMERLFRHILRLPADFFSSRNYGDIQTRINSIVPVQSFIAHSLPNLLIDIFVLCSTFIVMLVFSPILSLAVFSFSVVQSFISVRLAKKAQYVENLEIRNQAKLQTNTLETLQSINIIKNYSKEDVRLSWWSSILSTAVNKSSEKNYLLSINENSLLILNSLQTMAVVYLGAELVISGEFTLGLLLAYLAYRTIFSNRLNSFLSGCFSYRLLDTHLSRLHDITSAKREVVDSGTACKAELPKEGFDIELVNVGYQYAYGQPNVLENVNLKINFGETIAFVGQSGSGKTTILKILCGLIRPTEGKVLLNGIDSEAFGLSNFRRGIGAVFQDDRLFSGSISENISFFDENPDEKDIERAARLAAIHDDITKKTMGYNTIVGGLGSNLSAGQQQRIYLARALYNKPSFLFLDESTSNLDSANEEIIVNSLKTLGITRVIAAHRESQVNTADRIFEVKSGEVNEIR
ncbi:peptidase domain-containing ABC transporter [uncultured Pseudoteredinibacter sp.]|uniref:peptidase domain-containing ABC transporter n=1 Tax=uncultured Pseudoteredinibacter sp. TaxID=1641701 RepID=UPI0026091DF2|nr:peptidase domain-containing ABC transporter [uncultured Pseudoteredinibacter sp.]